MKEQPTKNQHYVPQSYINLFATSNTVNTEKPLVWVLDKQTGTIQNNPTSSKNFACERYFYDQDIAPIAKPDFFRLGSVLGIPIDNLNAIYDSKQFVENFFVSVEGRAAEMNRMLRQSVTKYFETGICELPCGYKNIYSVILVLQSIRTKEIRQIASIVKPILDPFLVGFNLLSSPVELHNAIMLNPQVIYSIARPLIDDYIWAILLRGNRQPKFITCDNPAMGAFTRKDHFYYTLSPEICLHFYHKDICPDFVDCIEGPCSMKEYELITSRQVEDSTRWLFATQKEDFICAQKYCVA